MNTMQRFSLLALRLALGWMYFYAGITKVLNPDWSAAGYLGNAKMFPEMYAWLGSATVLPVVNFINMWGLTLLGASLILGLFLRWSAPLGMLLMALYYLALGFPYPNPNSYIVDQHIIYIAALWVLAATRAGRIWGLDSRFSR